MFNKLLPNLAVGIFAVLWFVGGLYFIMSLPKRSVTVYDCGMAEWHPDIPIAVKEHCRKQRSGRI